MAHDRMLRPPFRRVAATVGKTRRSSCGAHGVRGPVVNGRGTLYAACSHHDGSLCIFFCGVFDEDSKGNSPFIWCCIGGLGNKRPFQWASVSPSVNCGGHLPTWGGRRLGGLSPRPGLRLTAEGGRPEPSAPESGCTAPACVLSWAVDFHPPCTSCCTVDTFLKIGVWLNFYVIT